MINFLHNFLPDPILISFFNIKIHWYGLFIAISIFVGLNVALKLTKYYKISEDSFMDMFFFVVIFGVIGARIYHVFLEFSYYSKNPLEIFQIWHGGIAIHGAIIGGILTILIYIKKHNIFKEDSNKNKIEKFWIIGAISVTGLAIAQAIGRWGNYFNQELFGKPTDLPFGIPIEISNRPIEYISSRFFHPTFLYESIGNLVIFVILLYLHKLVINHKIKPKTIVLSYAFLYSVLRFSLEFIRIDKTPELFYLRFPQIVSMMIIIIVILLTIPKFYNRIIK